VWPLVLSVVLRGSGDRSRSATRVLALSVAGVVLGFALLVPVRGITGTLVYGVSPRDPATVVVATAILLAVTAAAAFVPAWRASRIDPVDAIRTS
jgi:ABC-type antimicrobial peptide transport system permease subunit